VNYKTVESLLVGNVIPEVLNEQTNFVTTGANTTLNGTLQDLLFKLILGPDLKVTQTNLNNQGQSQSLQVANNTFIQAGSQVMPSQIDIASIVKDKKIQVNLHYVKVDLDQPQAYPFSIPGGYQPAN